MFYLHMIFGRFNFIITVNKENLINRFDFFYGTLNDQSYVRIQ